MINQTYGPRSSEGEARRKVKFATGALAKMEQKHRAAEQAYRERIAMLESQHAALLNEGTK